MTKRFLKRLLAAITGEDEEESEVRQQVLFENVPRTAVLDLVLLVELRDEGSLDATLEDLSTWTGIPEREVYQFVRSGVWEQLLAEFTFHKGDKRRLRTAILAIIGYSPDDSIGNTVESLVAIHNQGGDLGELESLREAVIDRWMLGNRTLVAYFLTAH